MNLEQLEQYKAKIKTVFKIMSPCPASILILALLVIVILQSNQIRHSNDNDNLWSYKAEYISDNSLERMAYRKFVLWAKEPVVIEAVKEANKNPKKTLRELAQLDNKWKISNVESEWMSQFLNSPCAVYLKAHQKFSNELMNICPEVFVCDKYGCIVATTNKTSDYWQGDEDKFIESFDDGKGQVYIRRAEYDCSSKLPLSHVSVPIYDPNSKEAIGVLTVGLNVHALFE
jgi:hypothetical protein